MAKAWFGVPGRMKWIPCPQSGLETTLTGNSTHTQLLNGRNFVSGSLATAKTFTANWMGTIDELQDIQDYANGVYGRGPFYYTDPMIIDNALPAPYAAPHMLEEIENFWITNVKVVSIASTAPLTLGLPQFSAQITRRIAPNYVTDRVPMTVAIPQGFKAVVRSYADAADAIRVAQAPVDTGVFALASTQPAATSTPKLFMAEYAAGFIAIHLGTVSGARVLHGLVVEIVPTSAVASPSIWRGGQGHSALKFGTDGLNVTSYMAKSANGQGQLGMSATLIEVW